MKKIVWMLGVSLFIIIGLIGCSASDSGINGTSDQSQQSQSDQTENPITKEDTNQGENSQSADEKQKNEPIVSTAQNGELKVYYFDVGQGDSILIQTANGKNILIDGGNNNKGELVVRYLSALGVKTIDAMIGTHPDADHIGGLDIVLANLDVKAVYVPRVSHTTITYEDFLLAVQNEGLKLKEAKAGVSIDIEESTNIQFLGPVTDYGSDLNTWSAVLKVTYGENSFLFTGDATLEAEEDMMAAGEDLQADVLKLGHHGADTSTGADFLAKVKPEYAVISAGKDNQYGHPTDGIIERLRANHINIYRTDELGTILAQSNGKTISFSHIDALADNSTVKKAESSKTASTIEQTDKSTTTSGAVGQLKASVNNAKPEQNSSIKLLVTGMAGAKYEAVFHYKSKDTVYEGTVGTPLDVRIGRAAAGNPVTIDITVQKDGKTYTTQTSFTPQ